MQAGTTGGQLICSIQNSEVTSSDRDAGKFNGVTKVLPGYNDTVAMGSATGGPATVEMLITMTCKRDW